MSVWGTNPRYIVGAKRQIELAQKYYNDWKVRIYTDDTSHYENLDVETILVNDRSYGMFWRFLPLFESEDSIIMVRDSDSRITIRETKAIQEWLQSDKKFHLFRDHEAHFEFPIIGCAFALKGRLSDQSFQAMQNYQKVHKYLVDQFYLRDIVYPEIQNNVLIHTMEFGWFGETRSKLINPYSFCGNGYDENDMPLYGTTLKECKDFNPSKLSSVYKFDEGIFHE